MQRLPSEASWSCEKLEFGLCLEQRVAGFLRWRILFLFSNKVKDKKQRNWSAVTKLSSSPYFSSERKKKIIIKKLLLLLLLLPCQLMFENTDVSVNVVISVYGPMTETSVRKHQKNMFIVLLCRLHIHHVTQSNRLQAMLASPAYRCDYQT